MSSIESVQGLLTSAIAFTFIVPSSSDASHVVQPECHQKGLRIRLVTVLVRARSGAGSPWWVAAAPVRRERDQAGDGPRDETSPSSMSSPGRCDAHAIT